MTVLSLDSVGKRYGATRALDDVTLHFPEGAITALIGRSGCGKSTLLRLCNGLIAPDSGSVRVFDAPLNYADPAPLRRQIGYAVQGTGLFPHLSVFDNITLLASLERWGADHIQGRLDELLQLTQLPAELLDNYPHQLSGGQQQRVGLCRAMMLHPKILLLDEPFAAIDPITRLEIHHQLLALHEAEPATTVLVTHDMQEALRLAQHLVVMEDGRVRHSGAVASLLEDQPAMEPEALLQHLLAGAD